jgi:hypothetical protein
MVKIAKPKPGDKGLVTDIQEGIEIVGDYLAPKIDKAKKKLNFNIDPDTEVITASFDEIVDTPAVGAGSEPTLTKDQLDLQNWLDEQKAIKKAAKKKPKKKKVKIERIKKETGLKTADEIPYSTVDDQLELISKKNQRADEIREIKTNRFNQMNDAKFEAALDAIENFEVNRGIKPSSDPFKNWNYASEEGLAALEKSKPKVIKQKKAPQLTPTLITKADGQVPLQVYDSSGQLKKYYEIQRKLDNELSKVEYGLVDKAHTLKGRAQKAIMSHTMRGFATQDPNFVIKVLNKDRDALGRLEQARDDYTEGMMELLKQKEELVGTVSKPGKIRNELVKVARKFNPMADEKYINQRLMDLSHVFPFSITNDLNPNSIFLAEGGNPKYMYLSPSYVNSQIQTSIEKQIKGALSVMETSPKSSSTYQQAAQQIERADQLLKKVKALSIIPVDEKTSIRAGMTELYSPTERGKQLTLDDYKELLYYLETSSGPFYSEGGLVEGEEDIVVDEDTGIMDYLTDNPLYNNVIKPIEEARDAKTEEYDLENNPQRVLPVMAGELLELPGEAYDALPNWLEGEGAILKNLDNPNAPSVALAKAATGLLGMATDPVAQLTKNIGDPERITTIPYPTWEKKEDGKYHYKDMQTLKLASDNPVAIGIDSLKAVGLGAAEAILAFSPVKLIKLGRNPGLVKQVGKFIVNDLAGPILALTTAYKAADVIGSEETQQLHEAVDTVREKTDKIIDNAAIENTQDAADFGQSQDPGYGFSGDYAKSGWAYGGEVTPGPFSESMQTGLEEEIDIKDLDLGPAYEGFEDLDIFEEARREGYEPVEVALNLNKVVGDVPKWVKQGKERVKMYIDNILPGPNTPETGTDVAIVDDVVENVTPLTRSEPGQIFYHQMEAEIERGPKVYNSAKEVYDFLNARGIGKVEVIDSEIKPMLEKLEGMGQPITREMLLGVVRDSPIRNVKSAGYGFLSDTFDGTERGLKYSGYKEDGIIPDTNRERVLYIDPKDLRGDTGKLPSSVSSHSFEEPYIIAWSRLSDRDLGGAFSGKTVTFADEIQSDIFQASQRVAGRLAAKMRHMADQNIPFDEITNELQRDMLKYFKDKGHVFRESMPSASALKVEYDKLVSLQNQLRELSRTPVPEITDDMLKAAKNVEAQQIAILDGLVDEFNLQLNKQLFPNLPFKLRDQWADASIKRDIYEAAYRKFVLKDPNATDFYAITPANLVTKRYSHQGSTATPQADRIADKKRRLRNWVEGGMQGDIPNSQYPGVGMYEFYGGPGEDVVTESGKHFTSAMEKSLKRIAKENNVKLEVLPVRISSGKREVFQIVDRGTGEVLGVANTGRQADAIANDIIANSDRKVNVKRAEEFDTAPSFGVELTPSMAEAFKAYMASGGYVADEEIVGAYGD